MLWSIMLRGIVRKYGATFAVEALFRDGRYAINTIGKAMGISRERVTGIKRRMDHAERELTVKAPRRRRVDDGFSAC